MFVWFKSKNTIDETTIPPSLMLAGEYILLGHLTWHKNWAFDTDLGRYLIYNDKLRRNKSTSCSSTQWTERWQILQNITLHFIKKRHWLACKRLNSWPSSTSLWPPELTGCKSTITNIIVEPLHNHVNVICNMISSTVQRPNFIWKRSRDLYK